MNTNSHISQEEFERIERYVFQTMNADELQLFEQELKTSTKLQQQVAEHKLLVEAIEAEALSEKLNEFHDEISIREPLQISNSLHKKTTYTWYAIAVTVVLLFAIGSFWYFNQSDTNETLFTKHFKPDPGLPTTMSETNNYAFYDAMVRYKQGDYDTAIKKWEALEIKQPENDTLQYFLGVAHLANKNSNAAIKYLDVVIKSSRNTFKNDAHYYLGLAHLKVNNISKAKENLESTTIENGKKIITELKK